MKDSVTPVSFQWIRGHTNVEGNERADELTRNAALNDKLRTDFTGFPISYTKNIFRQMAYEEWNERYVSLQTGSVTKMFFPTLDHATQFFKERHPNYYLTQMLTGHEGFRSSLLRWKINDNANCPCKSAYQDVNHLITECPIFSAERLRIDCLASKIGVGLQDFASLIKNIEITNEFIEYIERIAKRLPGINASRHNA